MATAEDSPPQGVFSSETKGLPHRFRGGGRMGESGLLSSENSAGILKGNIAFLEGVFSSKFHFLSLPGSTPGYTYITRSPPGVLCGTCVGGHTAFG